MSSETGPSPGSGRL